MHTFRACYLIFFLCVCFSSLIDYVREAGCSGLFLFVTITFHTLGKQTAQNAAFHAFIHHVRHLVPQNKPARGKEGRGGDSA
jgi:hypothetical protein